MKKYFFIFLIILPFPAHVYIDPATGSAIIAAIIGFFAAIIWNIKKIWYSIKKIISKNNK